MFSTGRHKLLYTIRNTASRLPRFVAQRCVAKSTGTLLTQGRGVFGSLGQGTKLLDSNSYNHTVSFDSISDSCDGQANISLAAAGWGHSAVLTGDGLLYIFGRPYDFSVIMRIDKIYRISNWVARYISASSNSLFFGSTVGYFPTPTRIETNEKIVGLSCSAGLTIFLTEIGNVYTFGLNRWGQCGVVPDDNAHIFQPTKVNGLPACQKIDAGLQHCIALTTEGEVYTWGKGNKGQLGTIADTRDLPPFALPALVPLEPLNKPSNLGKPQGRNRAVAESSKQIKAKSISAGFSHSAALSSEGSVYVWGKGMALEYKEKNAVAGDPLIFITL